MSGALYDEMKAFLAAEDPSEGRLKLLEEIEALDGSERMRRSLAFYWNDQPATVSSQPRVIPPSTPEEASSWTDPSLGIEFVYAKPDTRRSSASG